MMMDYSSIIGGLSEVGLGLAGGFGSKPQVAMWHPLSTSGESGKALGTDIGEFPDLTQLSNLYSNLTTSQMNQLLPGYSANLASGEKAAGQELATGESLLSGQIPQDVMDQIQRSDAYQSLSGGYAGSQMSHNLTARDLGLTSLDLMSQGAQMIGQGGNSAQQWASMAGQDILNPASFMWTPQQQMSSDTTQALLRQQALQNLYNQRAAPDPMLAGLMAVSSQFTGGGGGGMASGGGMDLSSIFNMVGGGGGSGYGGGLGGTGTMGQGPMW